MKKGGEEGLKKGEEVEEGRERRGVEEEAGGGFEEGEEGG